MLHTNSRHKVQPKPSEQLDKENRNAERLPLTLDVEILEERIAPAVDYFIHATYGIRGEHT